MWTCAAFALGGLEIQGAASDIRLELGETAALVPVRVHGGVSQIVVRRPSGIPVRASVSSGLSAMPMDDQQFGSIGGPLRPTHRGLDRRS